MEYAQYGRMKAGRCVSHDYGFMGCSINVLGLLDRSCSGRRSCEFGVPRLREVVQPCPKDLVAYLDASYRCIKVTDLSRISCNSSIVLQPSNPVVYIASLQNMPASTVAFVASCPLHIVARPSQSINFTLHSFVQYLDHDHSGPEGELDQGHGGPRICPAQMVIVDGQNSHSHPLCYAGQRERNVYVSQRSAVSLYFRHQPRQVNNYVARWNFILRIEAVGCAEVALPPGAWMERSGDRMTVRCNFSRETWYLTCIDNRWTGLVSNCTEAKQQRKEEKQATHESKVQFGMVVAVSTGVVLGFIAGFAMLLFVFLHRQSRRSCPIDELKMDPLGGGAIAPASSSQTEETALCSNTRSSYSTASSYPRRIFLECRYSSGMMTSNHGSVASLTPPAKFSLLPPPAPPTPTVPQSTIDCIRHKLTWSPGPVWKVTDDCRPFLLRRNVDQLEPDNGWRSEEEVKTVGMPRPGEEIGARRLFQGAERTNNSRPETEINVVDGVDNDITASIRKPDLVLSRFNRWPFAGVTENRVLNRTSENDESEKTNQNCSVDSNSDDKISTGLGLTIQR